MVAGLVAGRGEEVVGGERGEQRGDEEARRQGDGAPGVFLG